ncbi:hydroxymethylglutaryl-CoA lyase [Pseudomonas sp. NBRC 111123]|uniref:hydroxymethylglutaryl-CoA lyase n=1 Tax=Pseudomonas sp. NBRC 111123 TaxID=1661038 RepID=UPI000761BCF4|nr:hydroxymethylglutaryl-CoA lyase [Pseudomonas sp. NBRC 111123]
MAEHIIINEVGPRDGLQSQGKTLSVEARLTLIEHLLGCGVEAIEVGSFVSPKAVPQMAGTAELVARLPRRDEIGYSALVPNMRGYELAREAGTRSIAVVLSATETMNQRNINMSLAQARAASAQVLARAREDGIEARAYVAVAFECPFEGRTPAKVVAALTEEMLEAGAGKVIIADTIGAANPASVCEVLGQVRSVAANLPLSCHFHDTRAMALANVLAALEFDVREFDCSIGGLGGCPFSPGASGNLATEDLVLMLHSMGLHTGIDLDRLIDSVPFVEQLTGVALGGRSYSWLRRQRDRQRGEA